MPEIQVQDEQGNTHIFPDGSTPEMIAKALNVRPPASVVPQQTLDTARANIAKYPENQASIGAAPKPFTLPWLKSKFYNAADAMSEGLPAAGATAGALVGGGVGTAAPGAGNALGAVGGAGIGGMAGDAAKQLVRRWLGFNAPQTSTDAANEISKEGLTQGGIEAATSGLARFAPWLKSSAVSQYQKALAPTTRMNKSIAQEITPELIQRGEYGTLEGMEKRAGQNIQQLQPQLDTAYQQLEQNSPKLPVRNAQSGQMMRGTQGQLPGSGNRVIQDLEGAKQQFMAGGKVADPAGIQAIEGVQDIVRQYGPNVSPTTLRELRQVFENPVAKAGGYAGTDLSTQYSLNAKQQAADSIRRILNSSPSDIGALNKEISFWLDVQRVTRDSALRKTGQEGGLLKYLGPLGTALAGGTGFVTHGAAGGVEAGVTTALSAAAYQATRSPLWRTASAVYKSRLASALASGDVRESIALLARLGVAAPAALQSAAQDGRTTAPAQ